MMGSIQPTTLPFDPTKTGQIAGAIAITAVVPIITLSQLYAGLPFFGPVNDLTNAVSGLLSALLVWQLHAILKERSPAAATLLLLLAWAGATAVIINSVLVAFGVDFTQSLLTRVAYAGAAAGWLLFPVWCWLAGQVLAR